MFGTRWLTMLFGFAFFSHQVGGFLGVWLGGIVFERTGSYDTVWWLSVLFGVLSAIINLPIVEKPVAAACSGQRLDRHTPPMQLGPTATQSDRRRWRTPAVIVALRLPDRHHHLRAAFVVRLLHDADDARTTPGAATSSRSRSPCRR